MLYGTVYMKQFNIRISEDCNTFFWVMPFPYFNLQQNDMSYTWFKIRILIQWPVGPLDLKIKWPTAISRCPSIAKFMFTMGYGGSFPGKRLSKWYKSRHIWHIVAMTT